MLAITGLEVKFGKIEVLRGIELLVQEREILALLGPNGSGKSTLLRTLVGIVKPHKGSIRLRERQLKNVPVRKRVEMGITMVPQGRRLFPSMSVEENLKLGAVGRRDRENVDRDVRHWLEFFDLGPLKNRSADQLSGGQQQMVAVARGLMSRPLILMFDEPSLGVAPIVTERLTSAIRRLRDEEALTVVLVEQDVSLALAVADRVAVLAGGRIVLEDEPQNLEDRVRLAEVYFGDGGSAADGGSGSEHRVVN